MTKEIIYGEVPKDVYPDIDGHWVCQRCNHEFGRPHCMTEDSSLTFLCPECHSPEIKQIAKD